MNALEKALARLKELMGELDVASKTVETLEQVNALDAKVKEIEAQEKLIETLKAAEAVRARQATPAAAPVAGAPAGDTVPAAPQQKMDPHQKLSVIAAATMKAQVKHLPALKVLHDEGYAQLSKDLETEMRRKAIDTTTASVLIPDVMATEIIEFLRPETAFFQGGPKRVQFTSGKFSAPRGATGATAGYVGEGAKKPVTDVSFDSIEMSAKKLAAIVLITQEARDWSVPNIDAYIRDDLRATMAQTIDLNAFFGTGAGLSPTGILNISGVPTFDAADFISDPLAPTINEIDLMASAMILSLTNANILASPSSWRWLMNYRTLEYLKNLRVGDTTGVYAYPELRTTAPIFKGFPILVTNQVAVNGGATTDETTLSLVDFRHVLYGEEGGVVVKTSEQATIDVNGTLVHLFQQNMYAILTEHQHDFGLRHLHAVAKVNGLRAGANVFGSP